MKKQTHQEMIAIEFENAKRKHPKFCNGFTVYSSEAIARPLGIARQFAERLHMADDILDEEKFEAVEEYLQGRLQHCLVELAQCGAVVLRMMEYVQAEIDEKTKETTK